MRHEAPTQEIFNEMKAHAISIWKTYDNEFGYVTEKLDRINSFGNIQDNAMIFYRMFDYVNQRTFISKSSDLVVKYISKNQ